MRQTLVILFCIILSAYAWNGYNVTNGNYRLFIDEIADVTDPAKPTPVQVVLANNGKETITATVKLHKLADEWRATPSQDKLVVPPGQSAAARFTIVSGPKVYNMPYPVHAQAVVNGTEINAVRIFNVTDAKRPDDTFDEPPEQPVITVKPDSTLNLYDHPNSGRAAWQYYDQPLHYKPVGWYGTDGTSAAMVNRGSVVRGGKALTGYYAHPAWKPTCGPVFLDFRLKLPEQQPIRFTFSNAERNGRPDEAVSDGILYRVTVLADNQPPKDLYEIFTDSKTWVEGTADLSPYAGQTITLRLETNPGPHRNVYTDLGYWGAPAITAGTTRKITVADTGHGFLDDWLAVGSAVPFHGFQIALDDLPLGLHEIAHIDQSQDECRYQINRDGKQAVLTITRIPVSDDVIRFRIACDAMRISEAGLGSWQAPVDRLIYGHGYAIVKPGDATLGFGGHNYASSHIGLEFNGRPALLVAVDNPPDKLVSVAAENRLTPVTTGNCTFTIVTAPDAFQAAIRYRPLMDKNGHSTVKNLAGRFLYDLWGTPFNTIREQLQRHVRYGITDAVVTLHCWQRWGYDYRLPDIWPPNRGVGTVDDLKALGNFCDSHGILWGLHDNCTDFYPDADDFSIRQTFFYKPGSTPAKGWYNKGRKAQAMWFKPAATRAIVRRNYTEMAKHIRPTHCFVDVVTSVKCLDYYDDEGVFHSATDTRQDWCNIFEEIRAHFGPETTSSSEAGHDQLIGSLAGADCQWLTMNMDGGFVNHFPCEDWERVPWNDTVNHARFAWLGAGYSGRYQANGTLPRSTHGIDSDDYISMELLAGHNLMVDLGSWGFQAVRAYWLGQDFIRSVAMRNIVEQRCIDGNIHHQYVKWDTGAEVYVNRGKDDWMVNGFLLPQYGYCIQYPTGKAPGLVVFCKSEGRYTEYSAGPNGLYFNARTRVGLPSGFVNARPKLVSETKADGGRLPFQIRWDIEQPPSKDYRTFVHFLRQDGTIAFQHDHYSSVNTSQWPVHGEVIDTRTMILPDQVTENSYKMNVGLYTQQLQRLPLNYYGQFLSSIHVGTLHVKRAADNTILEATLEPTATPEPVHMSINNDDQLNSFGYLSTNGVCRLREIKGGWELIPAPNVTDFDVKLNLPFIFKNAKTVTMRRELQDGSQSAPQDLDGSKPYSFVTSSDTFKYIFQVKP